MRSRTYIRIFLLLLVASISFLLFSYSRKTSTPDESGCDGSGKCAQKTQSEFIIWESLTHNLLSASR